jgi:hypothetical protein
MQPYARATGSRNKIEIVHDEIIALKRLSRPHQPRRSLAEVTRSRCIRHSGKSISTTRVIGGL